MAAFWHGVEDHRWLITLRSVWRAVTWLRARAGAAPLERPAP